MEVKEDNVHPVVRLLVARMESHPEEFYFDEHWSEIRRANSLQVDRWYTIMENVRGWASPEEIKLLNKPFLDAAHRAALDELMNGPERRAEEERIRQEEHKRWVKHTAAAQQMAGVVSNAGSPSPYNNQLQNAYQHQLQKENQGLVATAKRALGLK